MAPNLANGGNVLIVTQSAANTNGATLVGFVQQPTAVTEPSQASDKQAATKKRKRVRILTK